MEGPQMKLSYAQFSVLHTLDMHGPKSAVEVILPEGMDGKRKTRLEWNMATGPTLSKLESAHLVTVSRTPLPTVRSAVGRSGHPRRKLTIAITDAGRAALAEQSN
jgi:DNA-binding MarR family transcriptional regulator